MPASVSVSVSVCVHCFKPQNQTKVIENLILVMSLQNINKNCLMTTN